MSKISILKELWEFLRVRKRFWLAPIIIVLVLISVLMIFAQSSAVAPFVYTLF
jgi:competence protein ComGC